MSLDFYFQFLKGLPPELVTMIVAMMPVGELRVSLPLALEVYHLPIWKAVVWSVIGDMIPATLILIFADKIVLAVTTWFGFSKRWYDRWVARTTKRLESDAARYGVAAALAIFVGIPLPFTGAWSGALLAFLFHMPKGAGFVAILIGVIIAAGIVTLVDKGIVTIFF